MPFNIHIVGHIRSLSVETLRGLFGALDFVPIKIQTFGHCIPNRHNLISRLLMWYQWLHNPLGLGQRYSICKYAVPEKPPRGIPALNQLLAIPVVECAHILGFIAVKLSSKCRRSRFAIYEQAWSGRNFADQPRRG